MIIALIAVLLSVFVVSVSYFIVNWANKQEAITKEKSNAALNLLQKFDKGSDKVVRISSSDVADINRHINYLAERVNVETQHNIDWINTYMAIGIGLLSIFGAFLPLLVNYFSKSELEKKIAELSAEFVRMSATAKRVEKKSSKIESDLNKSKSDFEVAVERVGSIEQKVGPIIEKVDLIESSTKKVPYIKALILNNAISRFTSSDSIRYYTEANRHERLADIFKSIRICLEEYEVENFGEYSNMQIRFLVSIIEDLKLGLRYSPIMHSLSKPLLEKCYNLANSLGVFTGADNISLNDLFVSWVKSIDDIISLIEVEYKKKVH